MNLKKSLIGALILMSSVLFADGTQVKLGGYCPVAYVSFQKVLFGDANISSTYKDHQYFFVNKDAKAAFDKEPEKFVNAIQFDAYCATGVALGKKISSNPKLASYANGKTYLFSSEDAKKMFDKDVSGMIAKADTNWKKAGGNPEKLK